VNIGTYEGQRLGVGYQRGELVLLVLLPVHDVQAKPAGSAPVLGAGAASDRLAWDVRGPEA
jgi:hypothetical protein